MKRLFFLFVLISVQGFTQTISGFVSDVSTGEYLSGVVVRLGNSSVQTSTNTYGFFSIPVNHYPASLTFSMVGYSSVVQYLNSSTSKSLHIELKIADYQLKEIEVKAEPQKITETPIGLTNISVARLKEVPALLGEKDILKSLALTPGVSNSVEGTTGLIVRGGGTDQNLIMIDETPVYNVSHLFGLVSVFNPDAVKDVNLYKSSFPAKYGGRLSSVIDITGKEGSSKNKNSELTVGLINSRMLFEGPIKKHKNLTYLLAGRFTNLFLVTFPSYINYRSGNDNSYLNYTMFDLNAKVSKRFDDNSQVYFSLFTGTDKYGLKNKESADNSGRAMLVWGSITGSVRYTKPLSQKLFLKSTVAYTRYKYGTEFSNYYKKNETDYMDTKTFLSDYILKSGLEYYINRNIEFQTGLEAVFHDFRPISLRTSYAFTNSKNNERIRAMEFSGFADTKIRIGKRLYLQPGIRSVNYAVAGKNYTSLEPRFASGLKLPYNMAFKAGYARMVQYIHMISNLNGGMPNDIFVPSTASVPPQQASQISAGISKEFSEFGLSIEAYHKRFTNLVDYADGKNFLTGMAEDYEKSLETGGKGEAWGYELFLDRNKSDFTGWISYSLGWSKRQFDQINDGKWYYSNFDRRHNIAATVNYKFSDNYSWSASWVFQSGAPVTLPVAYMTDPIPPISDRGTSFDRVIHIYGDRNNFRMPAYHRADVSFNFTKQTRRGNDRVWTLGVYNLYNHVNPFYLDMKVDYIRSGRYPNQTFIGTKNAVIKQSAFPFLPFINYTLKFK